MDGTVEAALISAAATIIGVGGTVIVAVTSVRNSRRANQATIDAANANAQLAVDAASANAKLTLEAAREGQFADRYSRALEQLGNDNQGIRIGGILALEGLALDSPRNHPTVMELLAAFIREHATKPEDEDLRMHGKWPLPDVRAALTVLSRRNTRRDIRPVDLSGVYLRGADLNGLALHGASLSSADLTGASLVDADFSDAKLYSTILVGANLRGANLTDAILFGANLAKANLAKANLAKANLAKANLAKAKLDGVSLSYATLEATRWPKGIKPPHGWIVGAPSAEDNLEGVVPLRWQVAAESLRVGWRVKLPM